MLKFIFLFLMAGGVPVAIAMAGASLIYILWSGNLPPFVVIHRMVGGIDSWSPNALPVAAYRIPSEKGYSYRYRLTPVEGDFSARTRETF